MGQTRNHNLELEVTDRMIKAGLDELREHSFADDIIYVIECVYRAMAYESLGESKYFKSEHGPDTQAIGD